MALATNSTPGSIVLGGDLTGTANAPELRVTGVVPGSFGPVNVVVDAKGRLVYAKASSSKEIMDMLPPASALTPGPIQVCDQLTMVDGALTLDMRDATTTLGGKVSIGSGLEIEDGVVKLPYATIYSKGIMQAGTSLSVTGGVLSLSPPIATNTTPGFVKIGAGLTIDVNGSVTANVATYTTLGVVKPGTNFAVNGSGTLTFNSVIATSSTTGVVKIGSGLAVDGAGSVTLNAPVASSSTTGVVKIGSGLAVDGAGSVSAPLANISTTGVVKIGSGLAVDGAGSISAAVATSSTTGVVKIGSGLAVDGAGSVTLNAPVASSSTTGVVKIGSGLAVDGAGSVSIPVATASTTGVVKPGTNITVDGAGSFSIPIATSTVPGVVAVGSGLDVDIAGSISAPIAHVLNHDNAPYDVGISPYPADYAAGTVIVPGTGIDLVSDTISVKTASYTDVGIAKFYYGVVGSESYIYSSLYLNCSAGQLSYDFGNFHVGQPGVLAPYTPIKPSIGFDVTDGVLSLSLPLATASTTGAVKPGTGISVDGAGALSLNAPLATASTTGIVKIGSGLAIDGAGSVTLTSSTWQTNVNGTVTKAQSSAVNTITFNSTINWDGTASNIFAITVPYNSNAITIANGTNVTPGTFYHFIITKEGGSSTIITYGSQFKFQEAYTYAAGGKSVLSCYATDSNTLYCIMQPNFV